MKFIELIKKYLKMNKSIAEKLALVFVAAIISAVLYLPEFYANAATLTISNRVDTVMGNQRVIMGEVTLSPSGGPSDLISTGLSYISYASISAGNSATAPVVTVKNSNDGTADSALGSVYITYSGADNTAKGNVLIFGN